MAVSGVAKYDSQYSLELGDPKGALGASSSDCGPTVVTGDASVTLVVFEK